MNVPLFLSKIYFFGEVENEKGLTLPFKVYAKDHPEMILQEQLKRHIIGTFTAEKMTVKFISVGSD